MIIPTQVKCDTSGCQQIRSETNHWFAVRKMDSHFRIYSWLEAERENMLETSKHFCGQTHALQFLSAEMGK